MKDQEIKQLINKEAERQKKFVELIASENFVSDDILEAAGSILTNKYAEGYPGQRYYGGCEFVDEIETLAINRLNKIFNAKYSNVQPHSGTQANLAAYSALIKPGDKILGLSLLSGGHLSHGYKITASGQFYQASVYEVDPKTELLNYETIRKIALEIKPQLIICGASAYSRIIDWDKFHQIAVEVGAFLLADVAHIAGLIVAGLHPNPLDYGVDVVTSTTHKTLRGPRGGIILTNNFELSQKINRALFPGNQGGPLMHIIAAKAIAFKEASTPEFKLYQQAVVNNCQALANYFLKAGLTLVAGGTDNHLLMINTVKSFGLTGVEAEELLYQANIVLNKNTIPFDNNSPKITSGIRIGTAAMTTKGFKEADFLKLAAIIVAILNNKTMKYAKSQRESIQDLLNKIDK